jgi:hypothetical protein
VKTAVFDAIPNAIDSTATDVKSRAADSPVSLLIDRHLFEILEQARFSLG